MSTWLEKAADGMLLYLLQLKSTVSTWQDIAAFIQSMAKTSAKLLRMVHVFMTMSRCVLMWSSTFC